VARQRQLARPPIKEALIDIRLAQPTPEQFTEQLGTISLPNYIKKPIRFQEVTLEFTDLLKTSAKNEMFGWRFESGEGARIVQLRRDGIGFSIMSGYTDWNQIRSLTQDFWNAFLEKARIPPIVDRLATRFINVIEVPIENLQFDDYLTAPPRIPELLPQGARRFFQRVEVPFGPSVIAIIVQGSDEPSPNGVPLILDIDVQTTKETPGDSPDIWTALDNLRKIKNDIFFSSVTERALEPYDK
jgi:uncharacterized protein (TIGR04255 family)